MDSILERVHEYPVPSRTRCEPMQVLALGISRSGTESLSRALDILGYKTYHGWGVFLDPSEAMLWHYLGQAKYGNENQVKNHPHLPNGNTAADFDTILAPYTAVTDFPACAFARELHLAYPSAKIILNTRPVDAWHASWLKTIYTLRLKNSRLTSRVLARFGPQKFWQMQVGKLNEAFWRRCSYLELPYTVKWIYEEHSAMVRGLVADLSEKEKKECLLEWTIGDGWEPLCRFLGKEVPKEDFPSGNATKEAMGRLLPILDAAEWEARKNFFVVVMPILMVVAALVWSLMRSIVM